MNISLNKSVYLVRIYFLHYIKKTKSKYHKNIVVFRMILISLIYITESERNITCEVAGSFYKKYRIYLCSSNIRNTTCKTAIYI